MAFLWSSFWFLSLQFFLAIMHWLESPVVLSRSSDSKDLDDEEKAFSVVPVIRHPVGFFVCRLSECKCCIMFMREIGIFYTICGSHSNEMGRIYLFFFLMFSGKLFVNLDWFLLWLFGGIHQESHLGLEFSLWEDFWLLIQFLEWF